MLSLLKYGSSELEIKATGVIVDSQRSSLSRAKSLIDVYEIRGSLQYYLSPEVCDDLPFIVTSIDSLYVFVDAADSKTLPCNMF